MTRAEYLKELEANLVALPKEERDMAVEFYNEYFEDAGAENEQAVIDELGKPFNLARSIIGETSAYNKSEVYIKYRESKPMPQNSTGVFASLQKPDAFKNDASFEEKIKAGLKNDELEKQDEDIMPNGSPYRANFTYERDAAPKYNDPPKNEQGMFDPYYTHANSGGNTSGYYNGNSNSYNSRKDHTSAGKILFWILMFIFVLIPIVIPVALAVIVTAAALAVCAVVCIVAAFIAVIAGFIMMISSFFDGIATIAIGIAAAGAGMILLAVTLLFFCKFLPWITNIIFVRRKRREV